MLVAMNASADWPAGIDVQEVRQLMEQQTDLLLLDCRTAEEQALVRLDNAKWIPMDDLEHRVGELAGERERHIVVYCHHDPRSMMVSDWLRTKGFPRVQYMRGGIDAWARQIDPSLPRY
jgi:rhodanese-related sulfurtransferase